MNIRSYQDADYSALISLYKMSEEFSFDEETDARERLLAKIERDPRSILLAIESDRVIGSVSIIEDGRVALLFRLVADASVGDRLAVVSALVHESERILRERGYKEIHNTAPVNNEMATQIRTNVGFTKGKDYSWFWKKILG